MTLLSSVVGAAFSLGCGADEVVDPVSPATTTTATTSGEGGAPPVTTGSLKRTIFMRSPLGEVPNNLLVDGDFELSVSYGSGQFGWRQFNSAGTGEIPVEVETGGRCRTGLTCARVKKGGLLFGRGTAAPAGKGHVISMYTKMPEGVACKEIDLIALKCDTLGILKQAKAEPELEDGWCRHAASFGPSESAVCFYISNSLPAETVALVDSAVLGPNDGTVPFNNVPDEPLSEGTLQTLARLRETIRSTQPFGKTPITQPPKN